MAAAGRFLAPDVPLGDAEGTGAIPHLRRLAGRVLTPRSAIGLIHEARCLATHVALYPLGLFNRPLTAHQNGSSDSDTFDLPVVLVHGYFHNRSGFFFMARELRRRGFRWVYEMNYNPLGETIPSLAGRLARHVEDVLSVSGAPRVHLVGHSLGGVIARWYVQEMNGGDKVDHCVTIGTPHQGTYAAYIGLGKTAKEMRPGSPVLTRLERGFADCPAKFVNLHSDLDILIVPPSSAMLPPGPNVHNHLIHDLGHTSLLISEELIGMVAEHLAEADVTTEMAEVRQLRPASGETGAASSGNLS